jgi:NMD protein affecting ribosome stability and mRNA decay
MKLSICQQCGEPFDFTEYSLCNDCRHDHQFIKLRKNYEETNKKKGKMAKMKKVFKEFGAGTLNVGKSSKKVTNPK